MMRLEEVCSLCNGLIHMASSNRIFNRAYTILPARIHLHIDTCLGSEQCVSTNGFPSESPKCLSYTHRTSISPHFEALETLEDFLKSIDDE